MSKEIKITVPDGKTAEWKNGVLTLVDEVKADNRPVTERIKTFEDACKALGENHQLVQEMSDAQMIGKLSPDLLAFLKLRVIAAALNEGWEPQFVKGEYRWFPWFYLYTQNEIDKMSEKDRSRVVLRSGDYAGAGGGVSYASAYNDSSYAYASKGSRLAFRTEKLAIYAGQQFLDIWADFVFRPKQNPQAEKSDAE